MALMQRLDYPEIILNTLLFISKMASDGDYQRAMAFGLSDKQLEELGKLSANDMFNLSQIIHSNSAIMDIHINKEGLAKALSMVHRRPDEEIEKLALVKGGASLQVMRSLCNMHSTDFAALRKFLQLSPSPGRTTLLTEQQKVEVWELWRHNRKQAKAKLLLEIYQETGLPIRSIWREILDYETEEART